VRLQHTDKLTSEDLYLASVYAVQNRSLGVRHNIEEAGDIEPLRGTFINGFFDTELIHYGEKAYGFPSRNEFMVSVPDAQSIEFFIEGLPVHYKTATVLKNQRSFDLKT
jgi:alpha,alpha-trehalose phosphorylase